jgi:hypothetical protein
MHAERIKISIPVSIKTCMTPITLWLQGIDDDRVFAVTHARLRPGRENDWGMRDEVWGAVFGMQSMRSRLFLMRCAVDGVSGEIGSCVVPSNGGQYGYLQWACFVSCAKS